MGHRKNATIFRKQAIRKRKENFLKESPKAKGDSGQYEYKLNDVTSEYDPALMGREGSVKFTELSKSDGLIGGILSAYFNVLLSCNWSIKEIEDASPKEKEVREILKDWFFKENNFENTLYSILKMLPIGFSLFNKWYRPFQRGNDFYMMPVLAERLQKSIWRIDYKGEFVEQVTSKSQIEEIPFKDLVFFTFRQEGQDKRGVSLLRQAYYDYSDKKSIKSIAMKGVVRAMLGLPIGKVPKTVSVDSPEYDDFCALMDMLSSRDYTDSDDSIIIPEDYSLEMWNSEFKINDLKEYLVYYDSSIATSVLTQFLLLGQNGAGGSYSLGTDQSSFFLNGLKYIVDYISTQFNKEVIRPAVLSNWGNSVDCGKFGITALNLDRNASDKFATTLKTLIDSGIIKLQESDEVLIREMYRLPDIDPSREEKEGGEEPDDNSDGNPDGNDDNGGEESDDEGNEEVEENSIQLKPIDIITLYKTREQRDEFIDQEIGSITKFSKASLRIIADKLISSIRWQIQKGGTKAQGLKDVKLNKNAVGSYKKQMGQRLSAVALKAWNSAKEKSIPHLKRLNAETNPSDLPSKTLTSFIINQSDVSTEKQVGEMRDRSLLIANTATTKGYELEQILAQVEAGIDDFIENGNNAELANSVSVTQAASYGELEYYRTIDDQLWGYRFENVSPKTNICQNSVGKVYRSNSAAMEMMTPPLHFRCKSFMEPIYKDEEKPDIDDYIPPASILKQKTL